MSLLREEPEPAPERVEAVDCLRGLMAWAVATYHLGMLAGAARSGSMHASVAAVLGLHSVEAFFVISGFSFFYAYGGTRFDGAEIRRFQLQRFLRIAPLFYLALVLNVVFALGAGPPLRLSILLQNLSFVFGLIHPNHALVTGGWSIGIEYVFYFAFPLLAPLARGPLVRLVLALTLGWLASWYSAQYVAAAPDAARFNAYVQLPNHFYAFFVGALIASLRARTRLRVPDWLAFGVLALLLAAFVASEPSIVDHFAIVLGPTRARFVAISSGLVCLFALARRSRPGVQRWLSRSGELSYPVYLLHPFAWLLTRSALPAGTSPRLALLAALGCTLVLALAARSFIDRPIQRWRVQLRDAATRRRVESAAPLPAE